MHKAMQKAPVHASAGPDTGSHTIVVPWGARHLVTKSGDDAINNNTVDWGYPGAGNAGIAGQRQPQQAARV